MLDKIIFKGYKSFKEETELEIKPITILFGKNSSGKSAVAKLPTLVEGALSMKFEEPFKYINKGVELGAEYRDIFYKREIQGQIDFKIFQDSNVLSVSVINSPLKPIISSWEIDSKEMDKTEFDYKTSKDKKQEDGVKGFLISGHPVESLFSLKVDYIGPFRQKPQRIFYINDLKNPHTVGKKGGRAYYLIAKDEDLESKVSNWFKKNFDGWELFVDRKKPYYEIKIRRNSDWEGINIVDVGQGMSQSLPIIIKALNNYKGEPVLNILEQPELHLHPAAHGNLAELIFNSTENTENKYLIETHSKNFILRLRTLIAKGRLNKDDINLYFIDYDDENETSTMMKININTKGEVDYWPENVFNETFEETIELKKAQNSKNGS